MNSTHRKSQLIQVLPTSNSLIHKFQTKKGTLHQVAKLHHITLENLRNPSNNNIIKQTYLTLHTQNLVTLHKIIQVRNR